MSIANSYGDSPQDGQALLEQLHAPIHCAESWLVETGAAVGAHAGPGTLALSLQPVFKALPAGSGDDLEI